MQPLDFVLQRAVDDIDYFSKWRPNRERDRRAAESLYDLMEAGFTFPKGRRKSLRPTKTQSKALLDGTLTYEEREAIFATLEEPLSKAEREAVAREAQAYCERGGWLESSRQAAISLRKAGKTVAANEIDVALRPFLDESSDATEKSGRQQAMRTAAEQVRTMLTAILNAQSPAAVGEEPKRERKPAGKRRSRGKTAPAAATVRQEAALADEWRRAHNRGGYKPDFARANGMSAAKFEKLLARVRKRKRAKAARTNSR